MTQNNLPSGRREPAPPRLWGESDAFERMRRDMDRLFEDFGRGWGVPAQPVLGRGFLSPKVNVAESEKGLEITAELPGVAQEDIKLDLENGVLTLQAEHKEEKEEKDEKKRYHLVERTQGAFMRRFALPFEPDAEKVEARFENGVLKVSVPRAPNHAPPSKRIAIG